MFVNPFCFSKGVSFLPMFSKAIQLVYRHSALSFCLWGLIIFVLCATPGQYIPSNNWLDLLSVDKLVHASIFCLLSLFGLFWLYKKQATKLQMLLIVLLCVLYGGSLELMQATVFTNRSADWNDVIANTFGCLLALPLLRQLIKKQFIFR